jgi:ABC-type enterochelin transport system permease subunit
MKTKIGILITVVFCSVLTSFTTVFNQEASIIGSWISEEDSNYKMVFNGSTCTWLYTGQPSVTYHFTLSNTSPQCGERVPVTTEMNYLKLVNANNSEEQYCYEIYSLSETTLTLRPVDKSGFLVFNRQP